MAGALLELKQLRFAYRDGPEVLAGISFSLERGEKVELVGANGSGKTTLFRCITGLEKNWRGSILLDGGEIRTEKDFQYLRRKIGYALQNAEDQLFFPSVLEDASFGPLNLGLSEENAKARALETLELFGIGHLQDALSYKLSGGQQKLVALAAVLAMQPAALLLDEPLNGLDEQASARVLEILDGLDCAMIIVAHDTDYFKKICSRRLHLGNGRLE